MNFWNFYIFLSFLLLFIYHEMIGNYPDRRWSTMTTQARVNAENIYTEILSITRRRGDDIFRIRSSGTGYVRGRLEHGAWNNTCMHDWPFNSRGHFLREGNDVKCNAVTQRQQRDKRAPADARPSRLITPINPRFRRKLPFQPAFRRVVRLGSSDNAFANLPARQIENRRPVLVETRECRDGFKIGNEWRFVRCGTILGRRSCCIVF